MIIGTILILLAWIVEMPLWLSVVTTALSVVHIVCRTAVGVMKICYYGD